MDLGVCFFLPEVHQVDLECRHCCIYRISQILVVTVEYLDLHVGCTIRPLEQLLGCFRQINCTLQGTGLQSVLNSNCIAQVVTISGALTRSYCQFIQSPNHLLGYRLFCCGSGCSCGCSSCSSCGCNDASFCSGCSSCSSCSCSSCSSCGCSGGSCGGSFCSCGSSSGCGFFGSGSCVSCSGFCINVYLVCTCYVIYAGVDIVVFSITIVKTLNLNRCQVALTIIAVADVYAVFHPVYRELVVRTVFIRLQFQIVCFCNRLYSCQISNVHGECCQCFAGNNAHAAVGAHGEYQTASFAVFLCIQHSLAQCRIYITNLEAVGDLLVRTRDRQDLTSYFRNEQRTNNTRSVDTVGLCYVQLYLRIARLAVNLVDFPLDGLFNRISALVNINLEAAVDVLHLCMNIVIFGVTIVKTLNFNRCQVALTVIAVADVYAVFHPSYREQIILTILVALQFQTSFLSCCCNGVLISNVHSERSQSVTRNNAHAAVGAHGEYQTASFAVFLCIHHGLAQCRICIADLEAVGDLLVRARNRQDLAGCFRNDHRTNDTSGADTICLCYFQLNLLVARFASYFADLPSEFIALVIGGNSSCSGCCSSGAVFSGCSFCGSGGGICYSTVANYDLYDCLGRILRQRVSRCILLTLNCSGHIFQRTYCCTIVFLICLYAVEISSGRHRDQILVCIAAADLYIIGAFCGILRNNNIEGSETQVSRLSTNKVCTVIRRSSNEAPGIVVVDVRNAVISIRVLYETSGGIARQIYCNSLFNIVCSNFPARIDVGIFDVRCTVFLLLDIAFLYLMGLVSSLICILVCQIIVCICIVVVFELDLVVAVGDQIGTKDLVTSNFSDYAVTLSVVVAPGVQVFILFEHRGHAECTAIRSAYDCAQTVRHSDIMLVDLGRCVENVLIVDTVCNCTAVCEGSVLGCNPVQLYRAQVVVIRPFFRIDENVQSLGNIASSDLVLRDADGLYAASLLLEEEIVRCAAIFGLFCGNRSRNRQCTERQCRNCHQSCNAEGQNLLCSFLHVFLSFPCRYCRQIRK